MLSVRQDTLSKLDALNGRLEVLLFSSTSTGGADSSKNEIDEVCLYVFDDFIGECCCV